MIGNSPLMIRLRQLIERAARTHNTVLILGESGTGKELVARALHDRSRRAAGPFVAVNCGVLSPELLHSELFGHERGAFTGADALKKGSFEAAHGGTLFLDEVAELTLRAQVALLRPLQERTIQRLGSSRSIPIDVRLIAATNRDLEPAIACGEFREELYYRLKVLCIRTPALRERPEDIPLLAAHFIPQIASEAGRVVRGLAAESEQILKAYHWPGNVRELQSVLQYAVTVGETEFILPADLPDLEKREAGGFNDRMRRLKRRVFEDALAGAGGDYRAAAAQLGISPKSIHRSLSKLDLRHLLR